MGSAFSLETGDVLEDSWKYDINVDWNGCRKFPPLPPPGEHPRLFFGKEEISQILARFTQSDLAEELKRMLGHCRRVLLNKLYPEGCVHFHGGRNRAPLPKEVVDKFFKVADFRHVSLLGAYVYGVIFDEPELCTKAKQFSIFYAEIVLRSREIALQDNVHTKPYDVWHSNKWDVGAQILFGGTSTALLYDIMFNDLSADEQDLMRKSITTIVKGRRPWGMGWASRRIQSNWAGYHGDLYTLTSVVAGEDGFDEEVDAMFSNLMVHYLDYGFYDSGHPIEDAYAMNLGLREGSLCFLAMARRGQNLFNHPRK